MLSTCYIPVHHILFLISMYEKQNVAYRNIVDDILTTVYGKWMLHFSQVLIGMFSSHCSKTWENYPGGMAQWLSFDPWTGVSWFDSLWTHMPGLGSWSPVGGVQEAADWWFSSLIFLSFHLFSFSKRNIYIYENLFKNKIRCEVFRVNNWIKKYLHQMICILKR